MAKMAEKAATYYKIIHSVDVRKVLYQLEISARDRDIVDELQALTEDEYNMLLELYRRYFRMIESIPVP